MRSKLERLRAKYNKVARKYRKYHNKLIKYYMDNDIKAVKECLNSYYGISCYVDTDTVIYKDFNKKQEV